RHVVGCGREATSKEHRTIRGRRRRSLEMKLLLDTNAYAALFRGNDAVAARVRRAEQVLISSIVAGELLFGFRNGSRYEANATRFEDFLSSPYVAFLPVTLVTADRFARIAAVLRRKGRPLPSNDI